eukprot:5885424-Pyramimonas_sp.AAC.1
MMLLSIRPPALFAFKRLRARQLAFTAGVALRFTPLGVHRSDVPGEVARCGERCGTLDALKRLVPGVRPPVQLQVGLATEDSITVLA